MSAEIELKLFVNSEFATFISHEIANYKIMSDECIKSVNCYYDTQSGFFAQKKMGVRVREQNKKYIMTIKTAGYEENGLHIRPEYNIEISSAKPEMTLFAELENADESIQNFDWSALQKQIQPLFNTDFERRYWQVELPTGTIVEVALDQGFIIAGDKKELIREVEFELLQGKLDDLLVFVEELCLMDGIRLGSASKAKRGYKLAGNEKDDLMQMISLSNSHWQSLEKDWSILDSATQLKALLHYEDQLNSVLFTFELPLPAVDIVYFRQLLEGYQKLYQRYVSEKILFSRIWQNKPRLVTNTQVTEKFDEVLFDEMAEYNKQLLTEIENNLSELNTIDSNVGNIIQQQQNLVERAKNIKRAVALMRLVFNE